MDRHHAEMLSAFFDGEPVDGDRLAESLAQPGASELLAEFATMRGHVQRDRSQPSPEFFGTMAGKLRESGIRRFWGGHLAAASVAATVLLAAGAGGFVLGSAHRSVPVPASTESPGRPAVIASSSSTTAAPPAAAQPPVAATPVRRPAGSNAAGPPKGTLQVQLAQWRETSSVAVEAGRH